MNDKQKLLKELGTLDQVVDRLEALDLIISFLFQEIEVTVLGEKVWRKRDILTDGEKICVNQERASLREYRDFLLGLINESDVRVYKVPDTIEKKLKECENLIHELKYKRRINDIEIIDPKIL
ncbi:hypothetical protein [Flavobacterium caeni]|uniref:Uncharacterized protein n=1 Tax=Flavobacterium caeni TaxID=490189 RepID=A0A1G5K291_9FLAO|nr:hypothetical protein [Flavobacterium caeni]SCY94331.1 hypothetical protein SAMN02927903_03020 [Flavobacterium caeni]